MGETQHNMGDNALVERTYQALMGVVQTTAISRKVLARPPFTFLHKLLVETLGEFDLFSDQQLQFSAMVTKQAKAAFLTRAIAFVTFVMRAHSKRSHISCLLLVSPVQVLAGVSVPDTLHFLLQLCEVCRMPDREIKDAAAKEVRGKGDAHLYSSGVIFRKGLVLIQRVIRGFLKRRVRIPVSRLKDTPIHGLELSMAEGTRFLKELADGRIYNGIIRRVQKNIFVLGYEEDPEAEDKVNEIEMKIILEESQRLSAAREGYRLPHTGSERADGEISLTDLPDLTDSAHAPGFLKRVSSRDSGAMLLEAKTSKSNVLKRAQSQRQSNKDSGLFRTPSIASRKSTTRGSFALIHEFTQDKTNENNQEESAKPRVPKSSDWQNSLKKILAEGRDQLSPAASLGPEMDGDSNLQQQESPAAQKNPFDAQNMNPTHIPSLPKLGIPGTKSLAPLVKRGSMGTISTGENKPVPQKEQARSSPATQQGATASGSTLRPSPLNRSNSLINVQRAGVAPANTSGTSSSPRATTISEGIVDTAFAGTYQTSDHRTQEKQALIRDVVMRIDSYMKRKRLRVIDLFRFCDADGNGSISPEEMIDTLSQMEIQLTPDEARDFLEHIDKDGNGSIDVDEFEELVRVSRRNEAQREQLKKELNGPRKLEGTASQKNNTPMKAKTKQAILDEFKAAQEEGGEGLNANQLRSLISRLALPGINDTSIGSLVDRSAEIAAGRPGLVSSQTSPPSSSQSEAQSPNSKCIIAYHHLAKALDELEWSKKSNRFLDQSWIRQFDSQLERAIREYELL
ncbi:TRAF3-interacting protein 1 [Phytophthora citrophthora]|uniref:TRAF3-interacting protein 1 n=1 Tax=Phytophthora citrophthora TaxID=4793 RepID=A0AAD9LJ15_9STRA|nr:TRAF3-interacting protein 1 [Phytophthora citrophthora]